MNNLVFGGPEDRLKLIIPFFENSGIKVFHYPRVKNDKAIRNETLALWVEFTPAVDRALLSKFPNLKYLFTSTTGHNHLDVASLQERGIKILSLSQFPHITREVTSTSELTWALVMAVWRRLLIYNFRFYEELNSVVELRELIPTLELKNKTLGLIGFGRIGNQLSKFGTAFGLNVIYFDPYVKTTKNFNGDNVRKCSTLKKLMEESHIVVLCASAVDNQIIVSGSEIEYMHKDAIIVNTGRASLWDEKATAKALEKRRIAGVGVDVFQFENFDSQDSRSPLMDIDPKMHNIVVTPHLGGATKDALEFVTREMSIEILHLLRGN